MRRAPLLVGIAGGSGSGKSTIAKKLVEGLPAGSVLRIDHDAYYHEQGHLSPQVRAGLNYDHPDALDNDLLVEHLGALRQGRAVQLPVYDFVTHSRLDARRPARPTPVVVVEGILVLADRRLRRLLDVKVFVDTAADIRLMRRIHRDIRCRGRSLEQVQAQYFRTVRPMHLKFVAPSKRWADLVIPEGGHNVVALDMILSKLLSVVRLAPLRAPHLDLAAPPAHGG